MSLCVEKWIGILLMFDNNHASLEQFVIITKAHSSYYVLYRNS